MISPELNTLNHEKILHALGIYETSASVGNDQNGSDLSCAQQDSGSGQGDTQFISRINAQISQCKEKILHVCTPRAVYRILPVSSIDPKLMIGKDIHRLLSGCNEAVLMALTLGAELERLLIREEVSNMSDAYVLDVCASEAVEEAADDFEEKLRFELKTQNKYLTNRYSPGYGDYPLSIQRLLLDSVNAMRAIGLTLTPTDLMVPRKSITAVMGISNQPRPEVYGGCAHCPIRDKCSFRRHGRRCYMES